MAEQVFLTQKGFQDLEKKLENLKVVRRKEVAEKIKIAREFGDISENAEYDSAKEEQAQVEGEILEIEQKLRTAQIIADTNLDKSIVSLGSKVKLHDIEFDEDVEYAIVGTTEADPICNRISNESPVGKALIGKKAGQTVEVYAPAGVIKFKILAIN